VISIQCVCLRESDKADVEGKDAAHTKFQAIAFAYAILSDERRRKRYDATGNISESLDIDDDDFNWTDFFKAQWKDTVTQSSINNFKSNFQNSEEERRDVISHYISSKGDLNKIFDSVMLSDPLDDEDRFRKYIDHAIAVGEVERFPAYTEESEKRRTARHRKARKEADEAAEHAEALGMNGNGTTSEQKSKQESESDLLSMIQNRSKDRATNFLDALEAKYAQPQKNGAKAQNGRKRKTNEPPETAFAKTGARKKKQKASVATTSSLYLDNDDEVDLEAVGAVSQHEDEQSSGEAVRSRKG